MTYFAFDRPSPSATVEAVETIAALKDNHNGKPLYVFALIDGAFDEFFFETTFRSALPRISLYESSELNGFGKAAPFLLCAPEAEDQLPEWVARLLMACGSRPMWSVIASAIPSAEFVKHFSRFLTGQCNDNLEWPIRWGDSRVLPELLTKLPSTYLSDILEPVYLWLASSRQGTISKWAGSGKRPAQSLETKKLLLDDGTFARLVEASEPDAVINQIEQTEPELLRYRKPSESYTLVRRQLEIADKVGIKHTGARKHFAAIALYLRDDFLATDEFQAVLVNVKGGKDYFSEVRALPEHFWNELSRT